MTKQSIKTLLLSAIHNTYFTLLADDIKCSLGYLLCWKEFNIYYETTQNISLLKYIKECSAFIWFYKETMSILQTDRKIFTYPDRILNGNVFLPTFSFHFSANSYYYYIKIYVICMWWIRYIMIWKMWNSIQFLIFSQLHHPFREQIDSPHYYCKA